MLRREGIDMGLSLAFGHDRVAILQEPSRVETRELPLLLGMAAHRNAPISMSMTEGDIEIG